MNANPIKNGAASTRSNTFYGAVSCLFICVTIAFIAHLAFSPHSGPARRLWLPVVVDTNGDQTTIVGESRQLEFWTPSIKTRDYLHKVGGKIDETDKWQIITNDDAVVQFGHWLRSNSFVLGYRRTEVWGQGRTGFKPGWWWTLNVLTNYPVGELGRTYEAFWKSHRMVFVEVIENRGSE